MTVTFVRKNGSEHITENNKKLDFSLLDFWQWSGSDLVNNALRGKLAEFIVKKALRITGGIRIEWDAYDLEYKDKKIEVKSSAFIQSWDQKCHSKISFGVQPTHLWIDNGNYADDIYRQSDIYVFCVLSHKDRKTIDPLNLDQWEFYVIRTHSLNSKIGNQKTITLSSLKQLEPLHTSFDDLKKVIDSII